MLHSGRASLAWKMPSGGIDLANKELINFSMLFMELYLVWPFCKPSNFIKVHVNTMQKVSASTLAASIFVM